MFILCFFLFNVSYRSCSIFGGGKPSGAKRQEQQRQKRPPITFDLPVTLEEIFSGATVSFNYQRSAVCSSCDGSGAHSPRDTSTCNHCSGSGVQVVTQMLGPIITQSHVACSKCSGTGTVISRVCATCKGKKVSSKSERFSVTLPTGVDSDTIITLDEIGDAFPDGSIPGDVLLKVVELPHPLFRRSGANLYMDRLITLEESLTGFTRKVGGLGGLPIVLDRPEGQITPHGFTMDIPSMGLPKGDGALSKRGSLFVTFNVIFPAQLPLSVIKVIKEDGVLKCRESQLIISQSNSGGNDDDSHLDL